MRKNSHDTPSGPNIILGPESFTGRDPWEVIAELREVIARLQEEFDALEEENRILREENRALKEENRVLAEEVQRLKSRINTDSHNSHKPPSSDGFQKKPRSLRIPGQRPAGGQPGHAGHTLSMVDTPDAMVIHPVDTCRECGHSLRGVETVGYDRRQVYDLPPRRFVVTEHRGEVKLCPACGKRNGANFPLGVAPGAQYGTDVLATAAYMMNHHYMPYKRLTEFFADVFGHSPSAGFLNTALRRAHGLLEGFESHVKRELIRERLIHCDETGARCEGDRQWVHLASTASLTYYSLQPTRGAEGISAAGILPFFTGVAMHDSWGAYFTYACDHALCNVHHLRELTFAHEEENAGWAKELFDWLLSAKKTVEEAPPPGLPEESIRRSKREYLHILDEGLKEYPAPEPPAQKKRGRKKQSKSKNLLDRMKGKADYAPAFLRDASIPFDNNLGERDMRMVKVKQKISGTFRSKNGADYFCRIRGYISTAKKQGKNVMEALRNVFLGKPFLPVPPDTG